MESDRPFLERVRLGYLELAGQHGWTVIDANQSEDLVFEEIKKLIIPLIPEEDREYLKARLF
jgi:thymidylate kinase